MESRSSFSPNFMGPYGGHLRKLYIPKEKQSKRFAMIGMTYVPQNNKSKMGSEIQRVAELARKQGYYARVVEISKDNAIMDYATKKRGARRWGLFIRPKSPGGMFANQNWPIEGIDEDYKITKMATLNSRFATVGNLDRYLYDARARGLYESHTMFGDEKYAHPKSDDLFAQTRMLNPIKNQPYITQAAFNEKKWLGKRFNQRAPDDHTGIKIYNYTIQDPVGRPMTDEERFDTIRELLRRGTFPVIGQSGWEDDMMEPVGLPTAVQVGDIMENYAEKYELASEDNPFDFPNFSSDQWKLFGLNHDEIENGLKRLSSYDESLNIRGNIENIFGKDVYDSSIGALNGISESYANDPLSTYSKIYGSEYYENIRNFNKMQNWQYNKLNPDYNKRYDQWIAWAQGQLMNNIMNEGNLQRGRDFSRMITALKSGKYNSDSSELITPAIDDAVKNYIDKWNLAYDNSWRVVANSPDPMLGSGTLQGKIAWRDDF